MTILQAFVLGLVQGATEFVPVSSSGHLTLLPWLLNWTFDPTLKGAFDVLAHWGTLAAVMAVFWREFWGMLLGLLRTFHSHDLDVSRTDGFGGQFSRWIRGFPGRVANDAQGRMAWLIVLGSIPAAIIGLSLESFFEMLFGTPLVVSLLLWGTAALLTLAEWLGKHERHLTSVTWLDALIIGLGQALAIAPGLSRSGATMAAGLLRNVERAPAARFSFWLSTPVILGAGVWQLKDLFALSGWSVYLTPLLIGFATSAIAGYVCIRFLLNYLRRGRLYPFAVYCALVGTAGLIVALVR
jgi:undecaprenyl-diphosphatase